MELQEIGTFIAVAREESFSRAADHLGYSQAAVTVHVRNLENELGVKLFDRLGKSIRLTAQGRIILEKATMVENSILELKHTVSTGRELCGGLNLGTIDSICSSVMPQLIEEYHRRHPQVSISVTTNTPRVLLDMLKKNEVDMVYLADEQVNLPWARKLLEQCESCVFAAPEGHPLADGLPHTKEELLSYPIMLTEKAASYRQILDTDLLAEGRQIIPVFESNNTDLLLELAEKEMCLVFLPCYVLNSDSKRNMHEIPVDELNIRVYRQLLYHKDKWLSEEMKALIELLRTQEMQCGENAALTGPR